MVDNGNAPDSSSFFEIVAVKPGRSWNYIIIVGHRLLVKAATGKGLGIAVVIPYAKVKLCRVLAPTDYTSFRPDNAKTVSRKLGKAICTGRER